MHVAPVPSIQAAHHARLDDIVLHPPSHYQVACKPASEVFEMSKGDVIESIRFIGDEYQLVYRLGSGGMGSVYKAHHLDGDVAIKIGKAMPLSETRTTHFAPRWAGGTPPQPVAPAGLPPALARRIWQRHQTTCMVGHI